MVTVVRNVHGNSKVLDVVGWYASGFRSETFAILQFV